MPWHCEEERHSYEICMYKEYEKRREILRIDKEAAKNAH